MFDFLVARHGEARPPKEVQIAHEVFGRPAAFNPEKDPVVRVYAHRLRAKLAAYAGSSLGAAHLVLPAGQYRLELARGSPPRQQSPAPSRRTLALSGALLAVIAAVAVAGGEAARRARDPYLQALRSPFWRAIADSPRPVLIVVGDYYVMGESDDGFEVSRLVRDYAINSKADLDAYLLKHPEAINRYQDLSLAYLPTSSAPSVAQVASLLSRRKPVRVVTTSQLNPQSLRADDIVYVGYLSGLGLLRDEVFKGSRFRIGASYDDLIDVAGKRRYHSQAGVGPAMGELYEDYAYVASFQSESGTRIAVVAGLRDMGAAAAAEQVTTPRALAALGGARGWNATEALYRVRGQGMVGYERKLLVAAPRAAVDR